MELIQLVDVPKNPRHHHRGAQGGSLDNDPGAGAGPREPGA